MSQTVLFAGGPLHGQTMKNVTSRTVMALEPPAISVDRLPDLSSSDPFGPEFGYVTYSVSRLAILGRIDAAKEASTRIPVPFARVT